jgi:hypothetical protein
MLRERGDDPLKMKLEVNRGGKVGRHKLTGSQKERR